MKVFVSINVLKPPMTGIGRYTLHLLEELLADPAVEDVKGFGDEGFLDRQALRQKVAALGQALPPSSMHRGLGKLRRWLGHRPWLRRLYRHRLNSRFLQGKAQLEGYVYWEPGYYMLPLNGPSVATLYDLSHIRHPELHPPARIEEMRRLIPDTLARATRLITISDFTRRELLAELQPSQPIDLVSPGVSRGYAEVSPEQRLACRQAYDLPEHFTLSVATLEPRKNLAELLKAFALLPQSLRRQFPLVLAGAPGWDSAELQQLIEQLSAAHELRYLGYVDQRHMPALYANATVLVYPSLYEGYGMPVAEAMATGCPVITSNVSSMPEVAGDAALLVDPRDRGAIAGALQQVLDSSELRARLATAGRQRTADMHWAARAVALRESLAAAQRMT